MKARVKKLGRNRSKYKWGKVGAIFEVTDVNVDDGLYGSFRLTVTNSDITEVYCLISNCTFIGGEGSEWEILDDSDNVSDAYDRAMGVL